MVLSEPGCKLPGREPVKARMRPVVIVVVTPALDDLAGMAVAAEAVLVQAFVAQPAIEALNEAVLHRLARGDVMPLDAAVLLPPKDRIRGPLGAVIEREPF